VQTIETQLSTLLATGAETLDIPAHLRQEAVSRYEDVGNWLADQTAPRTRVYPQGSFRLGTVVQPVGRGGQYDIDLVFLLPILKESTTQTELKDRVGNLLDDYIEWKHQNGDNDGPKACEPSRRCWTLAYPDLGFHLDVLPAIPDPEHPPTGILLTDKNLRHWQHSDPIGYANWFRGRSEMQRGLIELATKRNQNVADVPEWEIRTALQRTVQVLKWHAMIHFARNPDLRPPSILLTTLAAQAHTGQQDLFTAVRIVLDRMDQYIEKRNGTWWVPNPAHEEENFVDKWNEYPDRRDAFFAWRRSINAALDDAVGLQGKGLKIIAERLYGEFGESPIKRAYEKYALENTQRRETGALRMGSTGLLTTGSGTLVRNHTFHGRDPATQP
jgi:hypothetical protein